MSCAAGPGHELAPCALRLLAASARAASRHRSSPSGVRGPGRQAAVHSAAAVARQESSAVAPGRPHAASE
jgi:hypothetical protein